MSNNRESIFRSEEKAKPKATDFFTPKEIDEIKENSKKEFLDFKDKKEKGLIKPLKLKKLYGGSLPEGLQDFGDEGNTMVETNNIDDGDE